MARNQDASARFPSRKSPRITTTTSDQLESEASVAKNLGQKSIPIQKQDPVVTSKTYWSRSLIKKATCKIVKEKQAKQSKDTHVATPSDSESDFETQPEVLKKQKRKQKRKSPKEDLEENTQAKKGRAEKKSKPSKDKHVPAISDSESDFETRTEVLRKHKRKSSKEVLEEKAPSKKGRAGEKDKQPTSPKTFESLPKIHVRTSPLVLHSTLKNLRQNQKEYMASVGLGHLLRMTVDGTPTKIAYYAALNFDTDRCVMRFNSGEVKITREVVQSLLGLPLGQVKIKSMPFRPPEDTTKTDWEAQFKNSKDIRPNGVKNAILADPDVSLMFKVNMFVLLCNTLGKTKSMGTCDDSIMAYVSEKFELDHIDWCDYVLQCVKETRNGWNPHNPEASYFGPVILLTLLYLESVRFDAYPIERGFPAICYWNVTQMRAREKLEGSTVGFGTGELQKLILPALFEDAYIDADVQIHENQTGEEYLSAFDVMYDKLMFLRDKLDKNIIHATKKFPCNEEILDWRHRFNNFFCIQSEEHDEQVHPECDVEEETDWCDRSLAMVSPVNLSSRFSKSLNEAAEVCERSVATLSPGQIIKKTAEMNEASPSDPAHVSHSEMHSSVAPEFTFRMTQELADHIKNSPLKACLQTPKNLIQCPTPLSIIPIEKKKRVTRKPVILRSPYVSRAVEINKAPNVDVKLLGEWIASCQGEPEDIIFRTISGFKLKRFHMESLSKKCLIFSHAIDAWSYILNMDEDDRGDNSPLRLYCKTNLAGQYLENPKFTESERKELFFKLLAESIDDVDHTLHSIGLLFIPVVRSIHFFLIAIDFIQKEFLIIDNKKDEYSIPAVYGFIPHVVHKYMVEFLVKREHPRARDIANVEIERLEMKWRTTSNFTDCGVFLMRHMETFMGRRDDQFLTYFKRESAGQLEQLNRLRLRYLWRILYSPHNCCVTLVRRETEGWGSLSQELRKRLLDYGEKNIHLRLAKFG